jgi:four helix bundle protein
MTPGQPPGVAMAFDHEKLDVYQLAIDFVARASDIVENLPRGRGYLADQLQRAALSIVLNIAEGAGKFSPKDKAAFYLRARGSTTESAAILDVCERLKLMGSGTSGEHKAVLERISQMLTKLVKAHQQ